jgi:hypothetical protein
MIPKIIWLWWEQGWNNAPFICSYTLNSFKQMNPQFKINLVGRDNINDFIDTKYNWLFNCEGAAFRADIIRLLLLQKYGGVYADAATFCCINILTFIDEINFNQFWGFDIKSFNKKRNDKRTLCSWFYISMPNTYIINNFTNAFLQNAKTNPIKHDYYLHHHTLTDLIENDKQFQLWYNNLTKISGFKNRIHANFLSYPSTTILKETEWFHPNDIEFLVKNKKFKILKLRHKNIAGKNQLLKDGTFFRLIIDTYLPHSEIN